MLKNSEFDRNMDAIASVSTLVHQLDEEVRRLRSEGIPITYEVFDDESNGYGLSVTCTAENPGFTFRGV